jgi:hypothetical protein
MSATPHLTNNLPDGTEAVSNVQTLSRQLTAILFLCGCGKFSIPWSPAPSARVLPVPPVTDASGWPLYEVPAEGFALSLPKPWRQVQLNRQALHQGMQAAALLQRHRLFPGRLLDQAVLAELAGRWPPAACRRARRARSRELMRSRLAARRGQ